jgi:hypothetical protein
MAINLDNCMLKKFQWLKRVWAYLPGFSLIILMRLRFIYSPNNFDEGGALAIARAWSRGVVLYKDIWADRPQGLFVLYGGLVTIGLGTPEGVRILVIAACLLGAAAFGSIVSTFVGDKARLMPGGLAQLWNLLEGEGAPRFVVRYQVPAVCDASGASLRALHRNYKIVWTVAGLLVYERR